MTGPLSPTQNYPMKAGSEASAFFPLPGPATQHAPFLPFISLQKGHTAGRTTEGTLKCKVVNRLQDLEGGASLNTFGVLTRHAPL